MHPLLKRSLLFVAAIIVVLALLVWGIGLETLRARQVDLIYLGQQHMILVFSSMFFALLVGIPAGILLSRPAARGIAVAAGSGKRHRDDQMAASAPGGAACRLAGHALGDPHRHRH